MAHLVTGRQAAAHVGSDDVGAFNAGIVGEGVYILRGAKASMVNANTVSISGGDILMHGRHVRIDAAGETATIETGSQGMNRYDFVGIKYTRDADNDNIEEAHIHVIKGTPSATPPTRPDYPEEASILDGSAEVFVPLYLVTLNGISVREPELLCKELLPASMADDHVVAEGTSGFWRWRKWASGIAECWGYTTEETWPQTEFGSAFYDSVKKGGHSYPFPFVQYPTFLISVTEVSGALFPLVIANDSLTSLPNFYAASFKQYTELEMYEYFYAKGRYK